MVAVIDSIQFVLGDVQDSYARLQIQYPELKLRDPSSGQITGTINTDVPDLIFVAGTLPESSFVKKGATLSGRFRKGSAFKGAPAFVWTVNGEKGEVRLVSPLGPSLQAGGYDPNHPVTIEVHDFEKDEVVPIEWQWPDYQAELPVPARGIAALYEAFAAGEEAKYARFEDALRRHEQLEKWLGNFHA